MQQSYGKYRYIDKISQGSMGEVLLVENEEGSHFALKKVNPEVKSNSETIARFRREAEVTSLLKNPHIVQVFDSDLEADSPYLVMEYMKNGTLESRLKRENSLQPLEVLKIAVHISKSLMAIAKEGYVHRDIKPANILISEDGNYKLTDFGLAGIPSKVKDDDANKMTMNNTALGTLYYMAPEQAEDAGSVDIRADIYSLGATLYHCLTGGPVHDGNSSMQVMIKHISEAAINPIAKNNDLPENLCAVIMKMLERKKAERYNSPEGLLTDLEKIQNYDAPIEDLMASQMSLASTSQKNTLGKSMFTVIMLFLCFVFYTVFCKAPAPPDESDKNYQSAKVDLRNMETEESTDALLLKAKAIDKFLIDYPGVKNKDELMTAAAVARTLAKRDSYHINVKSLGNLKEPHTFSYKLFINGKVQAEFHSSGKQQYLNPDARISIPWKPGDEIIIKFDEYDWQNELMYHARFTRKFPLQLLSGRRSFDAPEESKGFFKNGKVIIENFIDEISQEEWQTFEDYIYPGEKW